MAEQPIFEDIDIPCPRCGYNLRGLVEARCPECGVLFDSETLLRIHHGRLQKLPLGWIALTVLRHPIRCWSRLQLRGVSHPTPGQAIVILTMAFCGLVCTDTVRGWIFALLSPLGHMDVSIVTPALPLLACLFIVLIAALVLQAGLCWVGLVVQGVYHPAATALLIVGYSAIWMTPALVCLQAAIGTAMCVKLDTVLDAVAVLCSWVPLLACLALWTAAIYAGTLSVHPHKHKIALWSAAVNLPLYVILIWGKWLVFAAIFMQFMPPAS